MTEKAFAAVLTEPRTFDYREYDIPDIGPEEDCSGSRRPGFAAPTTSSSRAISMGPSGIPARLSRAMRSSAMSTGSGATRRANGASRKAIG